MSQRTSRSALLASTMLLGVGLPSLAFAQDDTTDDEIVVTGSRIPSANAITASPVTTIGNVEFDIRGTTRVEDLVNTLPQAFAAQGANVSNGATGTAQVNLRGLGANRTLVLVDGRRLQYGSAISSAPDLNQIPAALIERVDVLSGGASAVYGSDAIGGVVNFIMIKDFEGVRIDGQVGGYQHNNGNALAQDRLAARGFAPPEQSQFDGKGQDVTLIIGANTEDGRGNVTAYAGYRNNDAILQADRDYSACAYQARTVSAADPNGVRCGGSATGATGTFFVGGSQPGSTAGTYTLDTTTGNTFISGLDLFNFAPTNFYQRPDERYTLGAMAHYEINEHADVYTQASFYDYTSNAQIAFSGTFFVPSSINCDNPLLSAQQATIICGANAGVAGQSGVVYPGRRLVEGAPRNDHIRLTSFRIVSGVRGEVMEGWNYDAFFQYANTHNAQRYENDVQTSRMLQALDVITGPGGPQCRDTSNGCVPLNIWQIGAITPAAVAFISVPSFQDGNTYQYMGQGTLTGDLGQYGMKSPWAEDGIGIAGGFEWRKDQLDYNPDALFQSGDLAGQGGTTPPTSGSIETTDLFIEAKFPLFSGMAFAESLTLGGGYRHSDVSTSGSYSTWKLDADWQVVPEIRFRGSWQRAARAANVIESFSPQSTGLTTLTFDPCAGAVPVATLLQCANTGVTAAQYGGIADNPALQYNAVFGGNPTLRPEVSDTYTVGVVLTPGDYVPGNLFISVDYFDIKVNGFVGVITAQDAIDNCLASGDPAFCSLIQRNPGNGSLWQGNVQGFLETNTNTGSLTTSGLDLNANWGFDFNDVGLGNAGALTFDMVGTYLLDLSVESIPGATPFDCAGTFSGRCGTPAPVWRHKLATTWEMPIGVDATVSWRMFTGVDRQGLTVINPVKIDDHLGGRHYIDLAASYNVSENWNVRVGVNNLLDKDPPQTSLGANGNTYPQTYDAQGRFLFVGTTIDF